MHGVRTRTERSKKAQPDAHEQVHAGLQDLVPLQRVGHLAVVEQRVVAVDMKPQLLQQLRLWVRVGGRNVQAPEQPAQLAGVVLVEVAGRRRRQGAPRDEDLPRGARSGRSGRTATSRESWQDDSARAKDTGLARQVQAGP